MKFYQKLLIAIILSAIVFIIYPRFAPVLWKSKIDKNIKEFNLTNQSIKNLFDIDKKDIYSKYNTKFDTEKLKNLGKKQNQNYDKIIKKIKEPYGSYWIDTAHTLSINKSIQNVRNNIYETNLKMLSSLILFVFIGLIILINFYKNLLYNSTSAYDAIFTIIFFSLDLGLVIAFFVVYSKSILLITLKEPINIVFHNKSITKLFRFQTIAILLEIFFVIFLAYKAIKLRSNKFVFFWFIPVIFIFINIFNQPKKMLKFYNLYKKENNKFVEETTKYNFSKLLSEIRQKNMRKDSLKFNKKPLPTRFADFFITKTDSIIKIVAKSKIGKADETIFYNLKNDSVKKGK